MILLEVPDMESKAGEGKRLRQELGKQYRRSREQLRQTYAERQTQLRPADAEKDVDDERKSFKRLMGK